MTVYVYKNRNNQQYIKVRRILNGVCRQVSLPIPTNATDAQLGDLRKKAAKLNVTLLPHPTENFLTWYWASGKPKNVSIDRSNLRLHLTRSLLTHVPLVEPVALSIGLARKGVLAAVAEITEAFFTAHTNELSAVDKLEFKTRLSAWVSHNYNC